MNIRMPELVTNFANEQFATKLQDITYKVVERLPFGSDAYAMSYKGNVLVRKGWIEPALSDLRDGNEIHPRHLWAISTLAFHEPHHIDKQRSTWWPFYLLKYVLNTVFHGGYRKNTEEVKAYERQIELTRAWFSRFGYMVQNIELERPGDE